MTFVSERISALVGSLDAMGTYCPQLWDGCYINRVGDVFACCHLSPLSYGNIHQSTLREIVNRPEAVQARLASLTGHLGCYGPCNLFDKGSTWPSGREEGLIDYQALRRLHISFGEACNIRCVMCDHPQRHAKSPLLLDPQVIIKNVDLSPFTTVMIQGGEPLYLKQCLDFMSYLESISKGYTLLTNGLLVDEAMAERLALHAKSVNVSLNGATKRGHELVNRGSRFDRVIENVRLIRRARETLGSHVALVGHMTITTSNILEIPLFIRSFRALGFDRVNFGYVKETVPTYLAAHPDSTARLRQETAFAIGGEDIRNVDTLRLRMLGLWGPELNASGV